MAKWSAASACKAFASSWIRVSRGGRTVIRMRYGLMDGKAYAQQEVAERLGISRSYISRIEKKALERLKEAFETGKMSRKS